MADHELKLMIGLHACMYITSTCANMTALLECFINHIGIIIIAVPSAATSPTY